MLWSWTKITFVTYRANKQWAFPCMVFISLRCSAAEPERQLSTDLRDKMIDTASELLAESASIVPGDLDGGQEPDTPSSSDPDGASTGDILNTASLVISLIGEVQFWPFWSASPLFLYLFISVPLHSSKYNNKCWSRRNSGLSLVPAELFEVIDLDQRTKRLLVVRDVRTFRGEMHTESFIKQKSRI